VDLRQGGSHSFNFLLPRIADKRLAGNTKFPGFLFSGRATEVVVQSSPAASARTVQSGGIRVIGGSAANLYSQMTPISPTNHQPGNDLKA
jgi:hypothetical protein